jgi:hypothetical protein
MDLVVFENNKPYVIDEYRQGRFDYVELASDVAETKFFQFLFDRGVVDKLAEHCPCPRQRQHVPMWVYISSQLSMRLHGSHSFHNYPFIIRSGGLIDALGPQLGTREIDEQGNVALHCPGFNDRNLYPRQTPCDQDYLRKLARDTPPEELEQWYNERAATIFGELGAYDSEGLFIADGTYLFVPDNENYEGSQKLLFDEHNHPVSKEQQKQMTPEQLRRCQWRRFYQAVLLLHTDAAGERFVVAGLRVLQKGEAEATALWPMVDTFVKHQPGVMKILLVDRGFIDGPQIGRLKQEHGIDVVIPIRRNMDILEDVRGLAKLDVVWTAYEPSRRPSLPKATVGGERGASERHPTAEKREHRRQQTLASQKAQQEQTAPADPSKVHDATYLARFEGLTSWSDCPVPLTGVLSREVYADGHEQTWLLVTTSTTQTASGTRDLYGLRTDIEERHRQVKCFWDLTRFQSTARSLVASQTVFVCLTYSLLQIHLLAHGHAELNRRTMPTTRRLLPDGERVIVYRQQSFAFFTLLEHLELTLSLEGKARRRALATTRRLRESTALADPASSSP